MSVETISCKKRKARKEHCCDYCGAVIKKGEIYDWAKNIHDGTLYEWKAHKQCSFLCSQLWEYADPDEGMYEELFLDSVRDFCQAFICPDCDKWDRACRCCDDDLEYCIDKAYDLLQTHELYRVGCSTWELRPRTTETKRGE